MTDRLDPDRKLDIEALRRNLETIFEMAVDTEQARLVAAAVNALEAVGFDLKAAGAETPAAATENWPWSPPDIAARLLKGNFPKPTRAGIGQMRFALHADRDEVFNFRNQKQVLDGLRDVVYRLGLHYDDQIDTCTFSLHLSDQDYLRLSSTDKLVLMQVFGEDQVARVAKMVMDMHYNYYPRFVYNPDNEFKAALEAQNIRGEHTRRKNKGD